MVDKGHRRGGTWKTVRKEGPFIPRRMWLLISAAAAAIPAAPKVTAIAEPGPWQFTVTAVGNNEFREEHAFRSRRTCEDERETVRRGAAQVAAEQVGTSVARLARRLHFGPCQAVRRDR